MCPPLLPQPTTPVCLLCLHQCSILRLSISLHRLPICPSALTYLNSYIRCLSVCTPCCLSVHNPRPVCLNVSVPCLSVCSTPRLSVYHPFYACLPALDPIPSLSLSTCYSSLACLTALHPPRLSTWPPSSARLLPAFHPPACLTDLNPPPVYYLAYIPRLSN